VERRDTRSGSVQKEKGKKERRRHHHVKYRRR